MMILRQNLWCEECYSRTEIEINSDLLYVCSNCGMPYPSTEEHIKYNIDIQKDNDKRQIG